MSDYIKREDAIKLKDICTDTYADKKYFIEQLKAIPSADVIEARHAEWQLTYRDQDFHKDVYRCSECRFLVTGTHKVAYAYCPNCGAKMDGERKE